MKTADGKYKVTRFMNQTSTLLEGVGETSEAAKADLKEKVRAYRESLSNGTGLVQVGERYSPGMMYRKTEQGYLVHQIGDRKLKIMQYRTPEKKD